MKQYKELLQYILNYGIERKDRTGVGTIGVFGYQTRFNLGEGFPLLTTKKMHLKSIIYELLWMLKGETNIKYLNDNGVTIWNEWADSTGELGPVYGKQWRKWSAFEHSKAGHDGYEWHSEFYGHYAIDQIANVVESIKKDPFSRRHIVSAWNVADVSKMKLPPCHLLFQFHVEPDVDGKPEKLNCQLYQRSADAFLGVPFNIASYALLTMMVAQVTGLSPGTFVHTFGDLHIYSNHYKQVDEQLKREPKLLPTMSINPNVRNIDDFVYEDFFLKGYDSWPTIKAPIAV